MIDRQEVLAIHQLLIQEFGGATGVRDEGLLQAAIARPFGGFGEAEFYQTPEEKAGSLLESIVKNHPFVDGNKRTGYVLMRLLLLQFGKDIQATQDEKYEFVVGVAAGQVDLTEVVAWIKAKVIEV